jgi:hypothetical protein
MKPHAIAMIVTAIVLTGCALPATMWSKPKVTQQQFAKDTYECEQDARSANNVGNGDWKGITMKGFYERCMIARGYTKVDDAPSFRAAGSAPGVLVQ